MYPTVLLRVLNFKLSDRAPPDKIALAEEGTVLFEIRSKDTEFLECFFVCLVSEMLLKEARQDGSN